MGTVENKTNDSALFQFAQTLSAAIGTKDANIQAHSERVAKYSREIAWMLASFVPIAAESVCAN